MRSPLRSRSIKSLYKLALAEGEGIGTAYEYFAKRLVLGPWLGAAPRVNRIMVAGLPEKYGSSLDFFLIAQELGAAEVVVIDDRPSAIEKARASLTAAQRIGELTGLNPKFAIAGDLGKLNELKGFDLCLGSEVLQRLSVDRRNGYLQSLLSGEAPAAIFTPNADNPGHTSISGLSGLGLDEMRTLVESAGTPVKVGYIDMPPFPPGITRSPKQRNEAAGGTLEAIAMWGLGYHARLEPYFPNAWRRNRSHIVYALCSTAS